MGLIAFLVLLGAFFLVAELVFLPGLTFGLVLSLLGYGAAIYLGFARLGFVGGVVTIVVVVALSLLVTVISLRAKTWQRLALKDKVTGQSMATPSVDVNIGSRGRCVSRLSPMGKVNIDGKVYEAKSVDAYIDQRSEVEVVGFENFTVIVKKID
ncbi:MAG: NfeD family protein [Alistipes sp.]|nr:NfeD family protein [Alistipes sp.]MBR3911522.1 NfeD family protein [Alistipes sp.]